MRIPKLLVAIFIAHGLHDRVQAQIAKTAVASVTAKVITTTVLKKNLDMNFGSVLVSTSLPGTLVMAPAGTLTAGGAGGVVLSNAAGITNPAKFTVSGHVNYTYSLTLPLKCTITNRAGNTMVVDSFTSSMFMGSVSQWAPEVVNIGAKVNIPAGQAAGNYNNSDAAMTVNYN